MHMIVGGSMFDPDRNVIETKSEMESECIVLHT